MDNKKSAKSESNKPVKNTYSSPLLKKYGDLRNLSKGNLAWSLEEGIAREMIVSGA